MDKFRCKSGWTIRRMEKRKIIDAPEDAVTEIAGCRDDSLGAMDDRVPGGVYLCQVDARISCGACCGLYNVADLSREKLSAVLARRSRRFARIERTVEAIEAFAREAQRLEPQQRPFAQLHHCPFIGLIGEALGRAGCLLHPLADGNGGVDFRGLSYYGGLACRTYFCMTTRELAPRWKRILRKVLDHWYIFGLVITETELLTAIFELLESRLGRPLDAAWVAGAGAVESLKRLLTLKCRWPFRPPSHFTACHYLFRDNAHPKPMIPYDSLGAATSVYDGILRHMPSAFEDSQALGKAEALIESHLDAVAEVLAKTPDTMN
jgi:hypothetical protein